MRKQDIRIYKANPKLAKKILKRKAKTSFKQIIYKMVNEQYVVISMTKNYCDFII